MCGQRLQVHEARARGCACGTAWPSRRTRCSSRARRAGDSTATYDLALGHLEALGEDLEVVDQRLHRLVDAGPRRRRDLLVLDPVVARRHLVEDLADDADRLADLVEADGVAVEAVAVGADDDVELDLVVVRGTACRGAGPTARRWSAGSGPVAPRAMASSAVMTPTPCRRSRQIGWPVSSMSYSSRRGGMRVEDVQHVVAPAVGQVGGHAAGADVVVVHPQAGDLLEERAAPPRARASRRASSTPRRCPCRWWRGTAGATSCG